MHGEERIVKLGVNEREGHGIPHIAVRHYLSRRVSQLPTKKKCETSADEQKKQRGEEILQTNDFMVHRPQVFPPSRRLSVFV